MNMNRLFGLFATVVLSGLSLATLPSISMAGDNGFKHHQFRAYGHSDHHRNWRRYDHDYFPHYNRYNPVVSRDRFSSDHYDRDGTYHSEDVVEDRHASFYDRGRNKAITRPHTSIESWSEWPNQHVTREHTSWIGADGRPHSTTIERETTVDRWGDTHTETHVTLKKKPL